MPASWLRRRAASCSSDSMASSRSPGRPARGSAARIASWYSAPLTCRYRSKTSSPKAVYQLPRTSSPNLVAAAMATRAGPREVSTLRR